MKTIFANEFKKELLSGNVNILSDSIKICLMKSTFTFDNQSHKKWSDVSSYEIPTGNGYTQNSKILLNPVLNFSTNVSVSFDNVIWMATGGNITDFSGYILYDDTHSNDIIINYVDFENTEIIRNGTTFFINNITIGL